MDRSDINDLKKLIKILEESNLQTLEIKLKDGNEIRLGKGGQVVEPAVVSVPSMQSVPVSVASGSEEDARQGDVDNDSAHKILSPMVGTIYLRPSPEDDNFVSVGDSVKTGDVICLVEAMKVFSKIKADKSGVVKSIKVEDGQAVEFGQVLLTIEG